MAGYSWSCRSPQMLRRLPLNGETLAAIPHARHDVYKHVRFVLLARAVVSCTAVKTRTNDRWSGNSSFAKFPFAL